MDRYAFRIGLLFALTVLSTSDAKVLYVDAGATGDGSGSDWPNACTTLTAGLTAAATSDSVWVKSATYVENITLKEGVKLYGGFPAAGSPTFEDRNWTIHESVIQAATNLPLVDCSEGATIDGFVLTGPVVECVDVSAAIANCTISGGRWRGGIYCRYSSSSVTNCVIAGNSGPGISCEFASPMISGCIIRDNTAEFRGAYGSALHCLRSSPILSGCTITRNKCGLGATLYLMESSLDISDCTIEHNMGPGISSSNGYSQTVLSRCTIAGNEGWGAGFSNWPLIYDGFPSSGESEVTVSQCVIADNRGKGLGFGGECRPTVIDCTIVANEGGISGIHDPGTVMNSILWNQGEEFMYGEEGSLTVSSSCVQGGREGEGNFDAYPRFEDYFGGNYRLQNGSPCIDAGTDVGLPYNGVAPDVGAYEMPGWYTPGDRDHVPRIVHVAADAAPGGDGSTWEKAYVFLREAFLSSGSGDEVWVKSATYYETIAPEPSVGVYGGFEGTETDRTLAEWRANPTVIDATGIDTPAVLVFGDCLINGFAITGASSERGGGISVQYGSPTISSCVIARNRSAWPGGGIHVEYSTSPIIRDCTITENSSAYDGGGVALSGMGTTLSNCVITRNSARSGGGMYLSYADLNITNCLIALNTAEGDDFDPASGGGVHCHASSPRMANCTISANSAEMGGGLMCEYGATPVLTNCILWNNSSSQIVVEDSTPTVGWSNVSGGFEGEGNINADPLFWDAAGGDYRLTAGSPCIDAGSNAAVAGILTDLDGNVRIWDGDDVPGAIVDMGAYEFGSMPPMLAGDTDGNGAVNGLDLFFFSLWWQQPENESNFRCDCVDDDVIDEYDLHRLMMDW
jgi:hypothetical protein